MNFSFTDTPAHKQHSLPMHLPLKLFQISVFALFRCFDLKFSGIVISGHFPNFQFKT